MTRSSNAPRGTVEVAWADRGHRLAALVATLLLVATALVWPRVSAQAVPNEPTDVQIVVADGSQLDREEDGPAAISFVVTMDTDSASDVVLRAEITGRGANPVDPNSDFASSQVMSVIEGATGADGEEDATPGEVEGRVSLTVVDDDVFERNEGYEVVVTATRESDGEVLARRELDGTLRDAADRPIVSVEDASANAGSPLRFRITRTGETEVNAVVSVAITNVTTTDDDWRGAQAFQVTVSPGGESKTSIASIGTEDDGDRTDERLDVTLTAVGNTAEVAPGGGTATGTILAGASPFDVDAVADDTTVDEGDEVSFEADVDRDAPDATYEWEFGDGETSDDPTPTHTFAEDGEYEVSVTVTSGDDVATDTVTITVDNVAPRIAIVDGDSTLQPVVGQNVTISAEVTDPGDDEATVVFEFGDGAASQPQTIDDEGRFTTTHAWETAGTFIIRAVATDDDGASSAASACDLAEASDDERCRQVLVAPAGRTVRSEGPARAATAANLALDVFGTADTVLVARQDAFPDALAAGPLAAKLGAPLLLSRQDQLSQVAADATGALGASRAVVLGGTAALSGKVVDDLEDLGLEVERIAGANRFATAAEIADEVGAPDGIAVLALGQRGDGRDAWPDALSAGAYRGTYPLLLTTPSNLTSDTASMLDALDPDEVVVLGGTAAIGETVRDQVGAIGATVTPIAGEDRYATSVAAFEDARTRLGAASIVVVATGQKFPDGLAAGAAAAELGANLMLADAVADPPEVLPRVVRDALFARRVELEEARLVGGPAALPPSVQDQVDLWID